AARRGENGGVGYTNSAIEVKEHGAINEHLLVEGRNAAAVEIARIAGIPAVLLDAGAEGKSSMSYDNAQGRNAELVDYGLRPLMAAIAGRLSLT
uniref:phage portal protein n=1 Tax=Pseudomonas viridiflava TaxID=33069 RepID=UPI0013CF363E